MAERKFKIKMELGNYVPPKEIMTEHEIREFAVTLINDDTEREIWKEKAMEDSIEDVIQWISISNITIEEIHGDQ